jgi:membrane protein
MAWTENRRIVGFRRRWRIVDLGLDISNAYTTHRTGRNASFLAYMGLLTVFPLLLAATTILGLVLEDRPSLQEAIIDSVVSQIPVVGPSLVQNNGQLSGSWWALAVGLIGAIWGSLRAFVALQKALDDVWEVYAGQRNYLWQRLVALICITAIGLAQCVTVALALLVGHAGLTRTSGFLLTSGGLVLNLAVIGSVYRYMTAAPMTWRMVWPGAAIAGLAYTFLQFVGTNVLTRRLADAEEVYGAFAGLIVLAFWISIHGWIALMGAELNAALERRRMRVVHGTDQPGVAYLRHRF